MAQSVGNADVANASRERAMQIHYRETNEGNYVFSFFSVYCYRLNTHSTKTYFCRHQNSFKKAFKILFPAVSMLTIMCKCYKAIC